MCGIAGAIDPTGSGGARWVEQINKAQAHRGPDDSVAARHGCFVLGNTRLAIQEPTPAGNQPFCSRGGRIVVVFNGEIYNYVELIAEHRLEVESRCDGAVLPELWARYGAGSLRFLRGMFAIAVLDLEQRLLTLARDPFGIKPLHWRRLPDGEVVFSSEVRPLARVASRPPLRPRAVADYFHLGALAPDESPFEGIESLAPNSSITFDEVGRVVSTATEPLRLSGHDGAPAGSTDSALTTEFARSVDLHLRADVPTALLLSAGLDSSAIASAASRQGRQLRCLTVVGDGEHDESPVASATAAHYGHVHERVQAQLSDHDVLRFFAAMQRPTVDGLNTFLVCRAVGEAGFKVALSGLGGDEALGGYSHARLLPALPVLRALDRSPVDPVSLWLRLGQRLVPRLGSPKASRLVRRGGPREPWGLVALQREVLPSELAAELAGVPPTPPRGLAARDGNEVTPPRILAHAEIVTYLQRTLLPDADAFSMCSSVELRVPFVDLPFFQAAAAADRSLRPVGKSSFIRALRDPYLTRLARRRKTGFAVPMTRWLERGPLHQLITDACDSTAPVWDVIDPEPGRDLLLHQDAPRRWVEPWSIAALNAWLATL